MEDCVPNLVTEMAAAAFANKLLSFYVPRFRKSYCKGHIKHISSSVVSIALTLKPGVLYFFIKIQVPVFARLLAKNEKCLSKAFEVYKWFRWENNFLYKS